MGEPLDRCKLCYEVQRQVIARMLLAGMTAQQIAKRIHRNPRVVREKMALPAYVFPSRTGQPLQSKPIGRRFSNLIRSTGPPSSLTLYSLRHTFASQLLDQGTKAVNVARMMGHKDVRTTLTFYAHAIPQDDTPDIDRLTAARQAVGDLNGDFVRTPTGRDGKNPKKNWLPGLGSNQRPPD